MDIFRVLSRGASLRKSKDIVTDYALPSEKQNASQKKKEQSLNKDVEKEIDFFRTKKFHDLAKSEEDTQKEEQIDQTHQKIEDEHNEPPPPKITNEEEAKLLRKSYRANVTGNDIPLPIGSFEDLISRFKLDQRLLTNLIDSGFTEPTPIQSEALPITLFDRDVLACAPTGSGKTLAFVIPLIQQLLNSNRDKKSGLRGLIISPTKELAQQIFDECNKLTYKLPLKVAILSKSISSKLKNNIIKKDKFDIIISTPLRLIDVVKNEALDLTNVEHLIFDEADKLFDKNFLEQTDDILTQCKNPQLRKSMFSATIPSNVEEIANQIMQDTVRLIIGHKEAANQQIEQKLTFCGNEEGKLIAIRQLIQQGEFKPPVLIFLQSITRAKALFHELLYDRLNVDVIHAERTQIQRQKIIDRFKKGEIWVLICTDVLARGIDFKGVNLVINYDVPNSAQAYVHRIGRTGRGGREGKAVTLYTKEDSIAIKPIVNVMKQSGSEYDEWMDNLSKITKNEKKNIKKGQIKRKDISTVPKVVKQKKRQREDMIKASKRRKQLTNDEEGESKKDESNQSDSE